MAWRAGARGGCGLRLGRCRLTLSSSRGGAAIWQGLVGALTESCPMLIRLRGYVPKCVVLVSLRVGRVLRLAFMFSSRCRAYVWTRLSLRSIITGCWLPQVLDCKGVTDLSQREGGLSRTSLPSSVCIVREVAGNTPLTILSRSG